MIFLYVLLSIVLLSTVYILFAPIYIEIDSINSIYRIRLHTFLGLSFFVNSNPLLIEVKIGFWKRQIDLSKLQEKKEPRGTREKRKNQKIFPFKKLIALIKSFKVNQLDATFDLGDMQWNGMLYPLFGWLSFKTGKNIYINFEGKDSIVLQAENNIARMSRAFLCS